MWPNKSHWQRGQIAPVALFGVLIAGVVLVVMFNTEQKVTERSLVANAADAAAHSGAVWTGQPPRRFCLRSSARWAANVLVFTRASRVDVELGAKL